MSLEVSFNVDLHGCGKGFRVAESEGTFVRLVGLHLLDSRRVKLIDSLDDGGEDAIVALFDQISQRLFVLGLGSRSVKC